LTCRQKIPSIRFSELTADGCKSFMNEHFTPTNELEAQLLAAQEGRLSGEDFMAALLSAQLFMPIYEAPDSSGVQRSQSARPLTLENEHGQQVVILFTSPERAKAFVADFPGYEGGLLADFTWILEKLGMGHGLSINPDWPAGIDMAPEMVDQLRQEHE
jgi:hypothetical protein